MEIMVWDECSRLLANCMIFYNTYMLSNIRDEKKREGDIGAVKIIEKISPIASQHINTLGRYEFQGARDVIDINAILHAFNEEINNKLK